MEVLIVCSRRNLLFHKTPLLIRPKELQILQKSFWESCKEELLRMLGIIVQFPEMFVAGICILTSLCFLQGLSNKKVHQFFLTIYHVLACFHFGDDQVFIVIQCNSVKRNYFTSRKSGIQKCQ